MRILKFDKSINFGHVAEINNDCLTVLIHDSTLKHIIHIVSNKYLPDFSNLHFGDEIVIFTYTFQWKKNDRKRIIGIRSKAEYDNAIRDSQKLPDGWEKEPYCAIIERYGTRNHNYRCKFKPDPGQKPLPTGNFYLSDSSEKNEGNRVALIGYRYYLPKMNIEDHTMEMWNESEYLDYIDKLVQMENEITNSKK